MAKRRKRGSLDPDYRTKQWRNSRYAPKNSSVNVSTAALRVVLLLLVAVFLIGYYTPELRPVIWSMPGYITAAVGGFILWILIAFILLKRERKRLDQQEPQKSPPPKTEAPTQPALLVSEVGTVAAPTPRDFEHEVAWVFNTLTPYKAIVSGGAGDGGVDIKVMNGKQLHAVVQCKRYNANKALSPQYVRELSAVKQRYQVNHAYLITTAYFSESTRTEAETYGIKLIDGDKFAQMKQKARLASKQFGAAPIANE